MVGLGVLFLRVNDPNAWLLASLFCGFVATPSFSHPLLMNPACARLLSGITRSFPECFARFSTSFCGISRVLSTGAPLSMAQMGKPRLRCRLGAARLGNWRCEDTGGGGAVGGRTRRWNDPYIVGLWDLRSHWAGSPLAVRKRIRSCC